MKTSVLVIAVNASLAALVAVPVLSAVRSPDAQPALAIVVRDEAGQPDARLLLVDDEEGRDRLWWPLWGDDCRGGHDDDDEGDEDADQDGEDDEGSAAGVNPAPAGTVAPPANGLFGNGAAPRVQVN